MTLRATQEAHGALLTAGAVMIGLGFLVAAFRNGLWLGAGLATIGGAVAIIAAALAWKDWRRPAPHPDQVAPRDPDRFWNAEKRLSAPIGGSAAGGLVALAAALLPNDQRWLMVGTSAIILVLASAARVIIRRRDG